MTTHFFSSTSLTPCTTPLASRTMEVRYTPQVWQTISHIVDSQKLEVGWLGMVEEAEYGYLITDIFVPKQTVSAAETDIDENAMADLALELDDAGYDISKLLYWGHSHVNMAVSPSGQDEKQVGEFLNNCPVFIRGIYNKRGESKVDVYDVERNVVHQCVPDLIDYPPLPDAALAKLDAVLKSNVTTRVYKAPKFNYQNYYQQQQRAYQNLGAGDGYQRLSPLASDVPAYDDFDDDDDYNYKLNDPFHVGGYS